MSEEEKEMKELEALLATVDDNRLKYKMLLKEALVCISLVAGDDDGYGDQSIAEDFMEKHYKLFNLLKGA